MNALINLLIVFLPLGVVVRFTPAPNVSIYPHDIILSLILAYFLHRVAILKEKIKEKKLAIMFLLFFLIGFISLLLNSKFLTLQAFIVSFAYLLRYASLVSIIFAFQFVSKGFKESIGDKLITVGAIFSILGIVQYIFYPSLRNLYYLGWDEHLYRLFSTLLDPNFAGAFLVLAIILLSDKIILSIKNKSKLILLSPLWLLLLLSIFLTYSRSAFIMLIVGVSILLLSYRLYKVIVLLGALFLLLFVVFSNTNIEGLNPLRIASVEARVDSMKEAIDIFSKNPILGVGFNAYRYAQVRYGFRTQEGVLSSNADAGTDNSFLFVLATTGIVGFLIFIDIWVNILRIIIPRITSDRYVKATVASICAILVNTLFINSLFLPTVMIWVFILVGLTVSKKQ